MEHRNTMGFALPGRIAAEAEPEAEPVPTGPTVTLPDQLVGQVLIPYERVDRDPAGPIQMLAQFTARHLEINPDQLVGREGDLLEHGTAAALFQLLAYPGADESVGWVIASTGPGARFRVTTRNNEHAARVAYAAQLHLLGQS